MQSAMHGAFQSAPKDSLPHLKHNLRSIEVARPGASHVPLLLSLIKPCLPVHLCRL
jgi:hypothetical protein